MQNGLQFVANSNAAIIVLHEIYGVNPHMHSVCQKYYSLGFDVYCPNLMGSPEHFLYSQQEKAYTYFVENVGFDASRRINVMAKGIRDQYKYVFLVGFSIGATLAWISSCSGLVDGAVCHYGSRIRDYQHLRPSCPVLLLFASQEASFAPEKLVQKLSGIPNVYGEILVAEHGFCDSFSPNYNKLAAKKAEELAQDFLLRIRAK